MFRARGKRQGHMATDNTESLSSQLERLRVLYLMLESAPDSQRHDELIERTRTAIAAVRKTRARLGMVSPHSAM